MAPRSLLRIALVLSISCLPLLAQSTPPLLGTLTENREGIVEDLAGPRMFVDPGEERIWIAQGRVRAAYRIGNRERMHDEDTVFSSAHPDPAQYEKPLALEFNNENGRLYTLTEAGLYREETVGGTNSQSVPGDRTFLDFSPTSSGEKLANGEAFRDLKLWPGTDRVFLLTSHRIISVVDLGTGGLELANSASWTTAMYPPSTHSQIENTTSDTGFNDLDVYNFVKFRIFLETADAPALKDHLIALLLADTRGYPQMGRPAPTVILFCDLGDDDTDTPVFDADPDAEDVNYAYYLSAPCSVAQVVAQTCSFTPAEYNIYDFDPYIPEAQETHAWVGCGSTLEIQEIDVGGVLPRPCTSTGSISAISSSLQGYVLGEHIVNVLADDEDPTRVFAITGTGFYSFLTTAPSTVHVTDDQLFDKGCFRDPLRTDFNGIPTHEDDYDMVVTAVRGQADHILKAMDVTANATTIPLRDEGGAVYTMFANDGAIIIPHTYSEPPYQRDDIYAPTWNGVVKFEQYSGLEYRSNASTFQPAIEFGESNNDVRLTETLANGEVGPFDQNREFLFTASARGDFMAYRTDENDSYRPEQPKAYEPNPNLLPSGWNYTTDVLYANDLAFLDLQPSEPELGKYILADLSRLNPLDGSCRYVLLAYEWDDVNDAWVHIASSDLSASYDPLVDAVTTATISVAPNHNWAVVAHSRGFFSVKLDLTNSTPGNRMIVVTNVSPTFSPGNENAAVTGLAVSNNRVFAYLNPVTLSVESEIRIYSIDSSTGAVSTSGYEAITNSAYEISGTSVDRAFRGRIDFTSSQFTSANVYFACDTYLLRFDWAVGTGGPSTDTFDFANWWASDYDGDLGDCRPYTLTSVSGNPRVILVSRDYESFAIVHATGQ